MVRLLSTSIADLLLHPLRWRIIQRVMGREVTTAQLRADLPDIAPATLYRHVAALLEGGVLRVVREERVRGAVERTYALDRVDELRDASAAEGAEMTAQQHRMSLTVMLAQIAGDFERLVDRGELPARAGELSYGQTALYVDPDEVSTLSAALMRTLAPYLEQSADSPKPRLMLSMIAIPDA